MKNPGRPKKEKTFVIRIPEGAINAVEAFIRLYKGEENYYDYAELNIEIAKTKFCKESKESEHDYLDFNEIRKAARIMENEAKNLTVTTNNDIDLIEKMHMIEYLESSAKKLNRIARFGIES